MFPIYLNTVYSFGLSCFECVLAKNTLTLFQQYRGKTVYMFMAF